MEQLRNEIKEEILKLLKSEVDYANDTALNSEERKAAIDRVINLSNMIRNQEVCDRETANSAEDMEFKQRQFEEDLSLKEQQFEDDLAFKKKQLLVDRIKIAVQVGSTVATMLFTRNWMYKTMIYEQTSNMSLIASKSTLKLLDSFTRSITRNNI